MDYIIKLKGKKINPWAKWIWLTAWRDARHNLGRLFLFISSIAIGISALVAINAFNNNLQNDINAQSKELLGADMAVHSRNKPFYDSLLNPLDSFTIKKAMDARFASMVYFQKNQGTRLIQVLALEGEFPFYGKVEVTTDSNPSAFGSGSNAMIDESLARQFNINVGDSLRLGNGNYLICGLVTQFPGNTEISATFAPTVYISYSTLAQTGLVRYGSRINYNVYYQYEKDAFDELKKTIEPIAKKHGYGWETVEDRRENLSNSFQNLYRFFRLLSFVALILGCIGVASSVHIYAREKRNSAAILRCLGASGWQIFNVFFIQIFVLGIIGSLIGVSIGIFIQYFLPLIVKDFLPLEVNVIFSPMAAIEGLVTGMIISTLFSILPLNSVRFVSPNEILRNVSFNKKKSKFRIFILCLIVLFPWGFAVYQTESLLQGSVFYGALILAFGSLYLVAKGLIVLLRKTFPSQASFIWKHSFSNLFRPNNQTVVMVVVIGLGAFLIATMTMVQSSLLGQVEFSGSGERSNTILFDIQPYQKDGAVDLANKYEIPVQQVVPVVTMRIQSVKGKTVEEWQNDTTADMSNGALTREWRVTYRDSLINSEKLEIGSLQIGPLQESDSIFISVAGWIMEGLHLEMGDEIIWNVQGIPITTYLGSKRDVDWQRVQTNFTVVFPTGVLETAPQFYVLVARIDDPDVSATFQQELVQKFPNISAIDLTLILNTLDQIFDKVAFVIRFMALFSILTGMVVLMGAVINSKFARLRENVLLRTLGAVQKQLTRITILEYVYLGTFAGFVGSMLAIAASWALSKYFFDVLFFPDLLLLVVIWFGVTLMTVLIGWLNTRSIFFKSPLEVLRKEV